MASTGIFQPWKTRYVELILTEEGAAELHIFNEDSHTLAEIYQLYDVTDITMVASKTHAHAFEINSGSRAIIVLSGSSDLESREWIWTLRKIFWPHVIPQVVNNGISFILLPVIDITDSRNPSAHA